MLQVRRDLERLVNATFETYREGLLTDRTMIRFLTYYEKTAKYYPFEHWATYMELKAERQQSKQTTQALQVNNG